MRRRKRTLSRRALLKRAAVTGAGVGLPLIVRASALGADGGVAASDRITMGAIGVGGRGTGVMGGFLGSGQVRVLAVCDVYKPHRDRAKGIVDGRYGGKDCAACVDFREITRRDDIDMVLIATPDHWHALTAIDACEHGKDVYCEKPLSLTIREGRAMVEAARRYERVFSGGSQRVYGDYGRLARYVHDGSLGRIEEVWVNVGGPSKPCDLPAEPVPEGMDWDRWLGPSPWAPFHSSRFAANGWRQWRDYSGGQMTDWGAHKFGGALYALGLDHTGPVEIIPPDGKAHQRLTYVFANGIRMYHGGGWDGNISYRGEFGRAPSRDQPYPAPPRPMRLYRGRGGITGDFLHCVRTRQRPFRHVEYSHRAASVCHLGNIAYWLNRPLKWDPDNEVFIGDDEANRWVERPKREPWRL